LQDFNNASITAESDPIRLSDNVLGISRARSFASGAVNENIAVNTEI